MKTDQIYNSGVKIPTVWTSSLRDRFLEPGNAPVDTAALSDIFGELYGMDDDAESGEGRIFFLQNARLLEAARKCPSWESLKQESESRPWACAYAARELLLSMQMAASRPNGGSPGTVTPEAAKAAGELLRSMSEDRLQKVMEYRQKVDSGAPADEVEEARRELEVAKAAEKAAAEEIRAAEEGGGSQFVDLEKRIRSTEERIGEVNDAARSFGLMAGSAAVEGEADYLMPLLLQSKEARKIFRLAGRFASTGAAKVRNRRGRGSHVRVDSEDGGLDRLADAMPEELMAMVDPELALALDARIAQGAIRVSEKRGTDPEERGPVVVCVDYSGSMSTTHEGISLSVMARSVAFSLYLRCRKEGRPFCLVKFAGGVQNMPYPQPKKTTVKDMEPWLNAGPAGGTNIRGALKYAQSFILQHSGRFKKSDVVLITDGEDAGWVPTVEEMKKCGVSTYGIGLQYSWKGEEKRALEQSVSITKRDFENTEGIGAKLGRSLSV